MLQRFEFHMREWVYELLYRRSQQLRVSSVSGSGVPLPSRSRRCGCVPHHDVFRPQHDRFEEVIVQMPRVLRPTEVGGCIRVYRFRVVLESEEEQAGLRRCVAKWETRRSNYRLQADLVLRQKLMESTDPEMASMRRITFLFEVLC